MPFTRRQAQQKKAAETAKQTNVTATVPVDSADSEDDVVSTANITAPARPSKNIPKNKTRKRQSVNLALKGQPKNKVGFSATSDYNLFTCHNTPEFQLILKIIDDVQSTRKSTHMQNQIQKLEEVYCKKPTNIKQKDNDYQKLISTCLWRISFPFMKGDKNEFHDAVLKFMKASVVSVGKGYTSAKDEKDGRFPILYHILQFIFRCHYDQNTNVRIRIMEQLRYILTHSQHSTLVQQYHEDLLTKVVLVRMRDKVAAVRIATLNCLPIFNDNLAARESFTFTLKCDPSPEARRAAVALMSKFPSIKTSMYIEKSEDPSEMVRAEAFVQISKLDLNRIADKDEKLLLIRSGLAKPSGRVREVMEHAVLPAWLNQCHNDLVVLFEKLELAYHAKTARLVIDALYPEGSSKEYQAIDWGFLSEKKLVHLDELKVEKSQLWLLLCNKFKSNPFCANLLLPEPSDVTDYLKKLLSRHRSDKAKLADGTCSFAQESSLCFSIALKICDILNFEECVRGEMVDFLRTVLLEPAVEDAIIINVAVDLAGKLVEKESLNDYLMSILIEFFDCTINNNITAKDKEGSQDLDESTADSVNLGNQPQQEEANTIVQEAGSLCATAIENEDKDAPRSNFGFAQMLDGINEVESESTRGGIAKPGQGHTTTVMEDGTISNIIPVHTPSTSNREPATPLANSPAFPDRISPIPHPDPEENQGAPLSFQNPLQNRLPCLMASTPIRVNPPKMAVSDRLTQLKEQIAGQIAERHRLVDKRDSAARSNQYLVCNEIQQQVDACIAKQQDLQKKIKELQEMENIEASTPSTEQRSILRAAESSSLRNDLATSSSTYVGTVRSVSVPVLSPIRSEDGSEPTFLLPGHSILKALMILSRFLGITKKITPFIRTLYSTRIMPCLEDDDARVRSETITLYCKFALLDKQQAKHAMIISLQALQYDILDAQVAGFHSVVDLIIMYSMTFFLPKEGELSIIGLPYPFDHHDVSTEEMEEGVVALLNKLGEKEPRYTDVDLKVTGIGKLLLTKQIKSAKFLADFLSIWIAPNVSGNASATKPITDFIQLFAKVEIGNSAMILEAFLIYVNRLSEAQATAEDDTDLSEDPDEDVVKLAKFVAASTSPEALSRLEDGYIVHENHIMNSLEHIKDCLESNANEAMYLANSLKFFTVSSRKGAQDTRKIITEILDSLVTKGRSDRKALIKKYLTLLSKQLGKKLDIAHDMPLDGVETEDEDAEPSPLELLCSDSEEEGHDLNKRGGAGTTAAKDGCEMEIDQESQSDPD